MIKSQDWICQLANWIWQHLSGFRTQRSPKRTWRSVAAPVREGMASPLHYSPASPHSAFSTAPCHHMSISSTLKHLANTRVCTLFPPDCCPPNVWCRKEKFLTASFLKWQPAASLWTLGGEAFFFPHTTPLLNCFHLCLLSPAWSVWSCCISKAVWPERFPSPASPPPSPGIMRTWRRRRNFAFLIFALRVWCLTTATENADNTVHNIQEGE